MLVGIEAYKENFRVLVRRLRKHVQDRDKEDIHNMYDLVKEYRMDVYFNKKSWKLMNIYKFSDGFKIEITNNEMNALAVILFNEVDLMSQNTKVEIKKEEDICFKNIWHFDKDLFEFFKNGDVNRIHTMTNYFKEEGREIYEGTCETNDVVNALMKKCTYINKYDEYVYKFDNGIQFALNNDDLETIAIVIVDAY